MSLMVGIHFMCFAGVGSSLVRCVFSLGSLFVLFYIVCIGARASSCEACVVRIEWVIMGIVLENRGQFC